MYAALAPGKPQIKVAKLQFYTKVSISNNYRPISLFLYSGFSDKN